MNKKLIIIIIIFGISNSGQSYDDQKLEIQHNIFYAEKSAPQIISKKFGLYCMI